MVRNFHRALSFTVLIVVIFAANALPWRHYSDDESLKLGESNDESEKDLKYAGKVLEHPHALNLHVFVKKTVPKLDENELPDSKLSEEVKEEDVSEASESENAEDSASKESLNKGVEWKKVGDSTDQVEMAKRKKKFRGATSKVTYHDFEADIKDETGSLEAEKEKEDSEDSKKDLKSNKRFNSKDSVNENQDQISSFNEQPHDRDEYKLAYQRKKIALTARPLYNGEEENSSGKISEDSGEKSEEERFKDVQSDTSIKSLVHGNSRNLMHGSVEYVKDETESEEEEEYDDDEDYEDEKEEIPSEEKEMEEDEKEGHIPTDYKPVFSSLPSGVPPLYLPSSIPSSSGGSDVSEETVEKEETASDDKNITFIDVPYRYMPLPVIDPLGYALAYPWLSVKEIVERVEDSFVLLNRRNGEEKEKNDSDRSSDELKTEVVDIEGKKYLLKTRSVKIGADGDTRAYVSLVSVTPYVEGEAKDEEVSETEDESISTPLNKKPEEEELDKETKKKETRSKKKGNLRKEGENLKI